MSVYTGQGAHIFEGNIEHEINKNKETRKQSEMTKPIPWDRYSS